jgi:hypothetical protein
MQIKLYIEDIGKSFRGPEPSHAISSKLHACALLFGKIRSSSDSFWAGGFALRVPVAPEAFIFAVGNNILVAGLICVVSLNRMN